MIIKAGTPPPGHRRLDLGAPTPTITGGNPLVPRHPDARPGSTGNVVAGIASFFVPGLGQLVQGRGIDAAGWFIVSALISGGLTGFWLWTGQSVWLWCSSIAWGICAVASAVSAALWDGRRRE